MASSLCTIILDKRWTSYYSNRDVALNCIECGLKFNEGDEVVSKRKGANYQSRGLYCPECAERLGIT